jgi:uncharacterized protein
MENVPQIPSPVRKTWMDRVQAVIEILLISSLISNILAALPFFAIQGKNTGLMNDAVSTSIFLLLDAAITFLLLTILMKCHRETIQDLGLSWRRWKPNIIIGILTVPFLFLINAFFAYMIRIYLPAYYRESNPLTAIIHTPQQLGLFIFSAIVAGGIKEELQRAFILNKFQRYLGGAGTGLVLWSCAFGAGHYEQGLQGIVVATIYGLIFGYIYFATESLIAPIVAHGAYNTSVLLSYWFFSDHIK